MKMKILAATAAATLAVTFGTSASALTTFILDQGNAAISGFGSPYGSVAINLVDSTHATVDFTATSNALYNYYFIAAQVADVNVNAVTWTLSGLTGNGGALSNGGSNQVDG